MVKEYPEGAVRGVGRPGPVGAGHGRVGPRDRRGPARWKVRAEMEDEEDAADKQPNDAGVKSDVLQHGHLLQTASAVAAAPGLPGR